MQKARNFALFLATLPAVAMTQLEKTVGHTKTGAVGLGLLASSGLVMAQADPVEAEIAAGKTKILALLAIGGAAVVSIALAAVGWRYGAKLISRMGNKG